MIDKVPTLKELLSNRKESHANSIIVSTNRNKDLFEGDVLNIPIYAWDKRDGIYITI